MDTTHDYRHEAIFQDTSSLRRVPKQNRKEIESKRLFKKEKHEIAQAFLAQLECKVGSGLISKWTASTGGIQIVWSKRLRTTAGRALVRRRRVQRDSCPGEKSTTGYTATIELSEKVLDNEG